MRQAFYIDYTDYYNDTNSSIANQSSEQIICKLEQIKYT